MENMLNSPVPGYEDLAGLFSVINKVMAMKKQIPVIEYRKDLPYTRILLHFPGGSSLEDEQTSGFAHFCEHLAFKLRVENDGIAEFVESRGGSSNAFTSNDLIVFEITILNKFVSETVTFLEKIFEKGFLTISDSDFEEEKRVVLEEMAMYEDEPMENLFSKMMYNLFPSHNYGMKIIGERETLEPATKNDLAKFMRERVMSSPFLVLGGGFCEKCTMSLDVPDGFEKKPLPEWKSTDLFEIKHDQSKNYFTAGWRLPRQDGRMDAILRMIYAVTYGMDGGRLYNELVYEKCVFDNLSVNTIGAVDASVFIQSAAFPSGKAKWRIDKWIDAWDRYRFTQMETARAREVLLSSEYFNSEGLGNIPEIAGKSYMLYGDKEKLEKDFFYEFMHLTADDLNRFKDEYLSFDKMVFGVATTGKCKLDVDSLVFPAKTKDILADDHGEITRKGVKGIIKKLSGSSFLTCYMIKKSGTLSNMPGRPGSFKLFLDALCTSADGMTRDETESYLDRFGITMSPVYGNNTGGIKFKVRDNFVNEAIDIIAKIFDNPIKEEDFNSEKLYSLSNISLLEEDPAYHIRNAVHYELFKGTPYENSISGSIEGLKKTSFSDVRKIRDNFFRQNSFAVAMAGSVDMEMLAKTVDRLARPGLKKTGAFDLFAHDLNEKVVKVPLKGRKQTHVTKVFRAPGVYDGDFETMKLLENYMTGQKSPLFQELREKQGLVYSLDVSGMAGIVGGYVLFSAITSPANTKQVMDSINRAIDHVIKGHLDEDYLEETKNGLVTAHANSVVKSNFHAFNIALEEALGQPFGTYMKHPDIIGAVTKSQLTETSLKWLHDGFWIIAGEV